MSCISHFAKWVLFVLNFLLGACSIILIVIGIMYFTDESEGVNVFFSGTDFSLGYIIIGVGVIIFFVAGFGCLGTIHENNFLLTMYGVVLLIIFAIELALGVFTVIKVVKEDDFFGFVRDALADLFDQSDADSLRAFYKIQTQFKCCGVNNFSDYGELEYPKSCCGKTPCYTPYAKGCVDAFIDSTKIYLEIIGYAAIAFAVVELGGSIFSFLLRRENIKRALKLNGHKVEETSI